MKWQSKPSAGILWPEIKNLEEKNAIATELANKAKDGDVIGVGSGSTAYLATLALGLRVRNEGLQIKVVSTSIESEMTCLDSGLETTTLLSHRPDWCFDGADEVDIQGNLNKGRGGAMLRERLIFEAAMRRYLIVDSSKFVEQLCTNFPIPFEIHPHAVQYFRDFITQRGHLIALRLSGGGKDGPVITESANLIVDVWFTGSARVQEAELASRVGGVFASGLFAHFDYELIGGAAR